MLVCWNGEFKNEAELHLDVRTNRAFRYGDGFFETIRFENNRIPLFKYHFNRIEASNKFFKFDPATLSFSKIENLIVETFLLNNIQSGIARLSFFRTSEGRYTPLQNDCSFLIEVTEHSFGSYFTLLKEVGLSTQTVLHSHAFSHLKTMNALPYVFAAMETKEKDWNECLLPNTKKEIAEGTWSSLIWLEGNECFTPPLSSGCVNSTMKHALKDVLASEGRMLHEKECQVSNLLNASELWLVNATRGIQAVQHFQGKLYDTHLAQKTASALAEFLSK